MLRFSSKYQVRWLPGISFRQPLALVASLIATQAVSSQGRPSSAAVGSSFSVPSNSTKLSAWCQSVPSSPGYFGNHSVRQLSTSGPRMLEIRSTIAGWLIMRFRFGMSRCRS